mgnify:CR=1 FL=1
MNKIDLAGSVWLASDIHLGQAAPATTEAFLALLDTARREASAIVLPGDIFDAWIGDDLIETPPTWLAAVVDGLKKTAASVPLWLGRGNRDFLLGQAFCAQAAVVVDNTTAATMPSTGRRMNDFEKWTMFVSY